MSDGDARDTAPLSLVHKNVSADNAIRVLLSPYNLPPLFAGAAVSRADVLSAAGVFTRAMHSPLDTSHCDGCWLDVCTDARGFIVAKGCDADEVTLFSVCAHCNMSPVVVTPCTAALQASPAWVANHYRWIVWKLGCEERNFPAVFAPGSRLNWTEVTSQLLRRYGKEVQVGPASRSA